MRIWIAGLLTGMMAFGAVAQSPNHDFLIIPNERVGPVTPQSSERALMRLYKQDAKRGITNYNFYERQPYLALYSGDEKSLAVYWCDDVRRDKPSAVSISGSKWRTREGVGLDTTVAELNRLNGRPFKFYGDGFDMGGYVEDWGGGRLRSFLANMEIHIAISRADRDYDYFSREKLFSSDDKKLDQKRSAIEIMRVGLPC